jgi:hypothetical protein
MKTNKPRIHPSTSKFIPKPDFKQLDDIPAINVIILIQNDINVFIKQQTENRKDDILQTLSNRYNKADMCQFLEGEITSLRTELENEVVSKWYNMLTKKMSEIRLISQNYAKGRTLIDKAAESEPDLFFLKDILDINSLLFNKPPKDFSPQKIDEMLRKLAPIASQSKRFEDVLKDAKPHEAYFTLMLFIHHEKHLLQSLISIYKQVENGTWATIDVSVTSLEKIEWQGTQKELAELFVELEKKGWIKEKNAELIKAHFTKSDTIHQVLKPSQDMKSKEKTYDGIYTPAYKASFDQIKPIKTHVK